MSDKQISDVSNLDPSLLGHEAVNWKRWRDVYKEYPHPFRFITALLREKLVKTRQEAGQLYRIARYFSDQSRILNKWSYTDVFDPRLAKVVGVKPDVFDRSKRFGYNLAYDVFIPQLGETRRFNVWVKTNRVVSPSAAYSRALVTIAEILAKYGSALGEDAAVYSQVLSRSITSFSRYIPEF